MEDDELREMTLADAAERAADIQHSFDTRFHELDFARKLYLIENCIYGVDIQPIATQIPAAEPGGRAREMNMREVLNGISIFCAAG